MKKLLVSDYDKTLYIDENSIVVNVKKITQMRDRGNLFALATGRTMKRAMQVIHKYNIPYDYLILSHGTVILDNQNIIIRKYTLDSEIVKNIIQDVLKYKTVTKSVIYSTTGNEIPISNIEDCAKIMFWLTDYSETTSITREIETKYSKYVKTYVTKNTRINFEVISQNTDKATAIKTIMAKEKITKENVYVIGDAENDWEMISEFNGYGMKKSDKCITEIAYKTYDQVYELIDEFNL